MPATAAITMIITATIIRYVLLPPSIPGSTVLDGVVKEVVGVIVVGDGVVWVVGLVLVVVVLCI